MTREEAIEYAEKKNLKLEEEIERPGSYYGAYAMYSTELEFVSMAISALRQQEHFRDSTKMVAPLTLEELRQMYGEPIWARFIGGAIIREDGWFVIAEIGTSEILIKGKVSVYKSLWYYGETWLAYRRKPEEGTV